MLEEGDFVYQSEQELFLVVADEDEDSYTFAVHGWRTIDKERLDDYLDGGTLHDGTEVEEVVADADSDVTRQRFEELQELFEIYEDGLTEDGPHEEFALDDTKA